jgi:hypothetical protein
LYKDKLANNEFVAEDVINTGFGKKLKNEQKIILKNK